MEKVTVRICAGTTCFVMGASQLEEIAEHLSPEILPYVDIEQAPCLGACANRNYGKAPFVQIDGEMVPQVTLPDLVQAIEQRVRSGWERDSAP